VNQPLPESPGQKAVGAPPATLVHMGRRHVENFRLQVTHYNGEGVEDFEIASVSELPVLPTETRRWINVVGLHEEKQIGDLCQKFGVHLLVAEDILNTGSMAKYEDLGSHLFTSVKVPILHEEVTEERHLSIITTADTVVTFCEEESTLFQPLRHRLQVDGSRIRLRGTDYFNWAVLDVVSDTVLMVINELEKELETTEDQISGGDLLPDLVEVHGSRRRVARLYRIARPFRDIVNQLCNSESPLMSERSTPYYRDLYDHAIQAVEFTEFLRDHAASLRELYYTTTSHRMNEVMKILAAISAIFLPLTFLAGLYGMNFDFMPELHWKWGYPVLLVIFITLGTTLVRLFRKKNWL
jgi:magnesium transporter